MKSILSTALAMLLMFCGLGFSQSEEANFDQFIGDWTGEGRFYNVNFSDELGTIRFTLRITPDMEITGTIGDAQLEDAEIEVDDWNNGYRIRGSVSGRISPYSDFEKRRITLLLKAVRDNATIGDFHLANNFMFDLTMRPGEIRLRRNP
ncbi:MAG: hypothetical protein K9M55_05880 [Candidatus Marinimicrobia bacterium]|nr:hypothetical protein [Candidatus Neomarinimicrobiota bacterium]MCF7922213.1 hypothetical protein [Candidatus Neomarinimicrobiota bacterium]